jgi:hypothetical protein
LLIFFFKSIGDVFEKDQTQHNVFVLGCIHILAQLIRRFPEGLFQGLVALVFGHIVPVRWFGGVTAGLDWAGLSVIIPELGDE